MIRSHLLLRAKPGLRDELVQRLDRLEVLAARRDQPGLLSAELQLPFDDDDGVLVWSAWASHEHYERWLAGAGPQQLTGELDELLAEPPAYDVFRVVDTID